MRGLDYTNPQHCFTSKNEVYTVTQDSVLIGTCYAYILETNWQEVYGGINLSINNLELGKISNGSIYLYISKNDVIKINEIKNGKIIILNYL